MKRRQRQGLPLYCDERERSTSSSTPITPTGQNPNPPPPATQYDFLHQHHHHPLSSPTLPPHSPLSSPLKPKPTFSSFPHDHIITSSASSSSSSPLSFLFSRPAPLLCNPLGFKRFRASSGYPLYVPPTIPLSASISNQPLAMTTTQLGGYSGFGFPGQLNSGSSQMYQTSLESNQFSNFSTKLELPLNQFSQPVTEPEIKFDMQMNDPALKNSGGGFLGDLLFDTQALPSDQTASKKRSFSSLNEGNDMFHACRGFDDLPTAYWSSPSG